MVNGEREKYSIEYVSMRYRDWHYIVDAYKTKRERILMTLMPTLSAYYSLAHSNEICVDLSTHGGKILLLSGSTK